MDLPSFGLEGKKAIITGAGRGIGRALAIGFSKAGAEVILCSRTRSELEHVRNEIENNGGRASIFTLDVTDTSAIQQTVHDIYEDHGSIDVLVNNAGMNIRSKASDVTEDEWVKIMDTNVKSAFMMSQSVGARMQEQNKGGSILSVSSVAGHVALKTGVVYAASKAAMIQMTKVLAFEWGNSNIRVNSIGPWYFETPLTKELLEDEHYLSQILAVTPLKRVGQVEELVGPALFLSSDAASYVTGQTLFVDGGMTINGF
ncbi:SDR family NAD(P)-dependent oxidoreductase [Jeotgalibacillus terrae]|uniref:SDR family NAD(P)-dependent oxidoreductase n=1 Tax=Jeotgalibacillus terrae TaxID=587735 RepID=A0ABW5ZKD1_9BACL|nr:glucose 1-dehydrogenase [Jeotgalibacillus terrae]MBM7577390.1 NAD(P)-dependent dehydrogenase (short-subunit alcohol dehydrogenase family) [Jeotgalibacillus terrae]